MADSKRSKITEENRREAARLKALWDDGRPRRTQAVFGEHYGLGNQANVGHYLNGRSALNAKAAVAFAAELGCKVADFSPRVAAELAQLQGAAEGTTHSTPPYSTDAPALTPAPIPGEPTVRVPILANAGSMGGGIEALHEDVVVGALSLSEGWVTKYVRPTRLAALRFIHGFGDSMSPTFEDGDILLVDTGVRDPQAIDGVYVLAANGRLYIKRVRCRLDGATEVSSDNPTVKTVDVLRDGTALDVLGRVVWCWNGRKL